VRRARPVREHDPEWFFAARFGSAFWKAVALTAGGVLYGLAVYIGGIWAALFGLLALVGCALLIAKIVREHGAAYRR
jgi:hypothetical protein